MTVPDEPRGDRDEETTGDEPSVLGASAPIAVPRQRRGRRSGGDAADGSGGGSGRTGASKRLPRIGPGKSILAVVIAIVLLALVPSFASGLKKTPRDKVGISYGGGPFEGAHYQRIVQPGSSLFFSGFFDPLYLYPADQRNYIISKVKGQGSTPGPDSVIAPSSDRVQLDYQVAVYFKLNTDRLRDFHEEFGLKYKAYTTDGWNQFIQDTFRQQIENTLQEETRRYQVADLFGNDKLLVELQDASQRLLSQRLVAALGEKYFCSPTFRPGGPCDDPTFIVKTIDIPPSVITAFAARVTSKVLIEAKQNEAVQRTEEAKGINALAGALQAAGHDYTILKAIESGNIKFWVLPSDSTGVTITGPDTGTTTTPSAPSGSSSGNGG
jgi:regulator of protease activity HflC (stomatin/prohibitin superfamily)